jgi:4-aminobutyrate aminotransferase-like enzyme
MTGAAVGEWREVPGPMSRSLLARLREVETGASIYPVLFGSGLHAPVMAEQQGVHLIDVDGNVFLDAIGGMGCAIQGYRPSHLVAAVEDQLKALTFLPEMPSVARLELAEELLSTVPVPMRDGKVHFEVSGSAANELALEIAFTYLRSKGKTGEKRVLSFFGAYHGRLLGTTSVSGIATYRSRFPTAAKSTLAHYPYCYRCPFGATPESCEDACLTALDQIFADSTDPATGECQIGIVISEPFQSHVTRIPPLSFYRKLRELCDRYDVVFIDDEVVGFGHTGSWFACDHAGVAPDIITMAKSLSGGMFPVGAVIARREIAEVWEQAADMHLTTYMGHPVGAAAALANIRTLRSRGLIDQGRALGARFLAGLTELKSRHQLIGYVDGIGLWLEAELVRDQVSRTPAIEEAARVQAECAQHGVLVDRSYGRSALYFIPPLTVTESEIDLTMRVLDEALTAVETHGSPPPIAKT